MLVLEESLKYTDGRMEGRADGAPLGLAVPAAVGELLPDQPINHLVHALAKVGADGHGHAVDAGLHLAIEEKLVAFLPAAVVTDLADSPPGFGAGRVQAELAQQQEAVGGCRPRLPVRIIILRRPVRAAVPLPVGALQCKEPGAPAGGGNPLPFGGNLLRRRISEVVQYLPADCGIGIKQPVQGVH